MRAIFEKIHIYLRDGVQRIWSTTGGRVSAFLGVVASLIAIWQFIIDPIVECREKRAAFDAAFSNQERQMGSERRSSTNVFLSTLPQNLRPTREYDHWERYSYTWNRHAVSLESFYGPVANGISNNTLKPGEFRNDVCNNIEAILLSHYKIVKTVSGFEGVSTSNSGSHTPELAVFGPVVRIPAVPNMEEIYIRSRCGDLEALRNPPDTRSDREKLLSEREELVNDIRRATELAGRDHDAELAKAYRNFVQVYASGLMRLRVPRPDAISEAEDELQAVIASQGTGSNFRVEGVNDAVAHIARVFRDREIDYNKVLERLRAREREIENQLAALAE